VSATFTFVHRKLTNAVSDGLSTLRLDRGSGVGIAAQIRARIALLTADDELVLRASACLPCGPTASQWDWMPRSADGLSE
jgi:hypothetical protein